MQISRAVLANVSLARSSLRLLGTKWIRPVGRIGQERGRNVAEVAHRKLGVALGEGQKLVQ